MCLGSCGGGALLLLLLLTLLLRQTLTLLLPPTHEPTRMRRLRPAPRAGTGTASGLTVVLTVALVGLALVAVVAARFLARERQRVVVSIRAGASRPLPRR